MAGSGKRASGAKTATRAASVKVVSGNSRASSAKASAASVLKTVGSGETDLRIGNKKYTFRKAAGGGLEYYGGWSRPVWIGTTAANVAASLNKGKGRR